MRSRAERGTAIIMAIAEIDSACMIAAAPR
jgi:hypothetical protein